MDSRYLDILPLIHSLVRAVVCLVRKPKYLSHPRGNNIVLILIDKRCIQVCKWTTNDAEPAKRLTADRLIMLKVCKTENWPQGFRLDVLLAFYTELKRDILILQIGDKEAKTESETFHIFNSFSVCGM